MSGAGPLKCAIIHLPQRGGSGEQRRKPSDGLMSGWLAGSPLDSQESLRIAPFSFPTSSSESRLIGLILVAGLQGLN